jgi:hypothetical protein
MRVATQEERQTIPYLPAKNWWDLRRRFIQNVPGRVTPDYLHSVLGIGGDQWAKTVTRYLEQIGLISDDGKLTDIANDWRSDEHYGDVCRIISERIYPPELREAFPGPDVDRDGVRNWFIRNKKVGSGMAGKLAGFYELLASASLPSATGSSSKARQASASRSGTSRATPTIGRSRAQRTGQSEEISASVSATPSGMDRPQPSTVTNPSPDLHVNIQIHIAPDATAEQIDHIFESMARHLRPNRN